MLRRDVVVTDVGEGRPRHVGEDADVIEADRAGIAHQGALANERTIMGEGVRQRLLVARVSRQGLRQREQRGKRQQADAHQRPKDRAPPGEGQDLPAHDRTQQGRHGHHRHQRGQHLRGPVARIEIAHHGAGQHDARAGADRLHHTPADHLPDGRGQRASRRADHEQDQPGRDGPPSSVAVADRPPQKLAGAEAGQVACDRPLDRARLRVQRGRHCRQRRQIEVGRDGREPQQGAEHDQHAHAGGGRRGCGHRPVVASSCAG